MFNDLYFFENRAFYEITWKNIVEPFRLYMKICRMRIARLIPKAATTHSEHVIHIAFPLQQHLCSRTQLIVALYILDC